MLDVVIPAHNEEERIGRVLAAVMASPTVSNVIVVADACTDHTATIAAAAGALVVPVNVRTKGTGMAAGLAKVQTETVLFIDADLRGLRPEHVTVLATHPPVGGMVVGVRGVVDFWSAPKVFVLWPSISGERRIPADFVRQLHLAGRGWETETAINVAVAKAGLPHAQIILKGVANDRKKGFAGVLGEAVRVAAATAVNAPELARYTWTLS
jgi:glycosyltransferase involved in cell wall biosynthesis